MMEYVIIVFNRAFLHELSGFKSRLSYILNGLLYFGLLQLLVLTLRLVLKSPAEI